jgi:hypothetical protein
MMLLGVRWCWLHGVSSHSEASTACKRVTSPLFDYADQVALAGPPLRAQRRSIPEFIGRGEKEKVGTLPRRDFIHHTQHVVNALCAVRYGENPDLTHTKLLNVQLLFPSFPVDQQLPMVAGSEPISAVERERKFLAQRRARKNWLNT